MWIYIINLFLVTSIAVISAKKKNKWVCIILVSIPLICISGFRYGVGTDFYTYRYIFKCIQEYSFDAVIKGSYSNIGDIEPGFVFLMWIFSRINENPQFLFFITSLINVSVVVYVLRKYSENFGLSIYLYITTMIYYSTFNGLRQWMASVIMFWAIKYIIDKKIYKYIVCVLIAATIHKTALILIPVYFIVNFKPFGKKFFCVFIAFAVIAMSLESFLGSFGSIFSGSRYESYMSLSATDDGVNIFKVFVAFVPVILSYIYYKRTEEDNQINIFINFSMMYFMIMFLAMQSTVLARIGMYFSPYNLLLYSKFINMFKNEQKRIYSFAIEICFFVYMCLLLPVDSNLLPYETFFYK